MYVRNVVLFVIVVAVVAVNAFIAFVVVDIARLLFKKKKTGFRLYAMWHEPWFRVGISSVTYRL